MAANSIPLDCNICPKKPTFSDVSHLLTHIASKGHLSNYYRVKVRSTQEEASRHLVDTYDRWYAEWGVEELMSERMREKDKRRIRARPAPRPMPTPKIEEPALRPARRANVGTVLDPRLSEQQQTIKMEHSITPTPLPQYIGPVLRHRNTFAPHIQYWPTESRASSHSYLHPDLETSSEFSDPTERRRHRYTAANSCAIEDDLVEIPDPMAVSESTKLKGVYWPGMDIFDSATPEMRRKRNQKKDSSVVHQLELNSQEVQATELIFTPQGSFKRLRRISSSDLDEDDEAQIKAESPQPLRRRHALANMDPNASRRTRIDRVTYLSGRQYDENRGGTSFDYKHSERIMKRKRGALDVFQDDDQNVHYTQPTNMAYLNSAFAQPSASPMPAFASYKPLTDPFQFENKENIQPPFHSSACGNFHGHPGTSYHYQSNPYHSNPYQNNAYQNSACQNNACQNNACQINAFQNKAYQNNAYQNNPYQNNTYHGNQYGMLPDQYGLQYDANLYNGDIPYEQNVDEDDERTITAPPSPLFS